MLRAFVFLTILSIAATEREIKLTSLHLEDEWNDELKFWGRTTCRTGRRRLFSLHESPHSSRRLHDFFSSLVTKVQTECGATMKTTKSYLIVDGRDDPMGFLDNVLDREEILTTNPPEIIDESDDDIISKKSDSELFLFPHSDAEIVVSMVEDCVRVLMDGNVFNNWNNRRLVLVLIISRIQEPRETRELLVNTVAALLQRLWRERRILNVFFAAPLSSLGRRVWFYDPFFKNVTSGMRGKIFAQPVREIPSVERVKDLKGYTLNIGMFDAHPAAIKYEKSSGKHFPFSRWSQHFVGMDGLTMATVASRMNFTLNIVPPSDGLEFGYVCVNGTFVGTIGDAAYHRIDIGFNSMYMKLYSPHETKTNAIEFTVPIDFDRLCVVVPRAQKIPRWLRTFYYFHPAIWMCLVLTQILASLVWYLLRNFHGSSRESKRRRTNYQSILVDTFLVFIGAPLKMNPSHAEKMFLSAFLLFGVTVMGTFSGTLYHSFTSEMRYNEVANLKEVDASGIGIATTSPNLQDVFGLDETEDDSEEVMSLRRKFRVLPYNNLSTIRRTAHRQNVASLSRENSFRVTKYRYVDDSGHSLLHLVRECPRAYYLSYVVPKDSVYIERLNDLIMQLREAGLPPLWNSVTTNKLIAAESAVVNKKKRVKSLHTPFNMQDMQTTFILLFIGYIISFSILIGEICYQKKHKGLKNKGRIRREVMDTRRQFVSRVY